MLFRARFYADAETITSICLHEHREKGTPLVRKKIYCQRTVGRHFQLYGGSLVSAGSVLWWNQYDDLSDEEKRFADWCMKRRW